MTDTTDLSIKSIEAIGQFFKIRKAKIAQNIFFISETDSTNDIASAYAQSGCPEGTVIIADRQLKGRGRLGRKWFSPPGKNIYMSIVLRPEVPPQHSTIITIMASVAVAIAAMQISRINARIKWPNDIMVSGKKLAGILSEIRIENNKILYVVIGVGININTAPDEMPDEIKKTSTSLYMETAETINRASAAMFILEEMNKWYNQLNNSGNAPIIRRWTKLSTTIGKTIRVASGAHVFEGTAEAIDNDGFLLMRLIDGSLKKISSGDVTVIQ